MDTVRWGVGGGGRQDQRLALPHPRKEAPRDRRAYRSNAIEKCGLLDRGMTGHWPQVALSEHVSRARGQKADWSSEDPEAANLHHS